MSERVQGNRLQNYTVGYSVELIALKIHNTVHVFQNRNHSTILVTLQGDEPWFVKILTCMLSYRGEVYPFLAARLLAMPEPGGFSVSPSPHLSP